MMNQMEYYDIKKINKKELVTHDIHKESDDEISQHLRQNRNYLLLRFHYKHEKNILSTFIYMLNR